LNDTWWPTENGWPMGSNMLNQDIYGPIFPTLPGSITKITPGWDVRILNEKNEECDRDVLGRICIKLPAPPSHTMTIWGNDTRYVNSYLKENPGYYIVGDEGIIDKKGYLHVLGRIDDVINVAGHRLDTGRIEEVIV
jgi:propionyl-CoA synthetase